MVLRRWGIRETTPTVKMLHRPFLMLIQSLVRHSTVGIRFMKMEFVNLETNTEFSYEMTYTMPALPFSPLSQSMFLFGHREPELFL